MYTSKLFSSQFFTCIQLWFFHHNLFCNLSCTCAAVFVDQQVHRRLRYYAYYLISIICEAVREECLLRMHMRAFSAYIHLLRTNVMIALIRGKPRVWRMNKRSFQAALIYIFTTFDLVKLVTVISQEQRTMFSLAYFNIFKHVHVNELFWDLFFKNHMPFTFISQIWSW
jgi:hypothetical protein